MSRTRTAWGQLRLVALLLATIGGLWAFSYRFAAAQDEAAPATEPPAQANAPAGEIDLLKLLRDGSGAIGMVIVGLSVAMVALIVEHLISIRRGALMPHGLAEYAHQMLMQNQAKQGEQACRANGSYLGHVLAAGLSNVGLGYGTIEKALEDSSVEQSARLFRKVEYLSVIGTLAPMLGLLGTVWGMIIAFHEFEQTVNPQVSQLAPGIYKALVTTLEGLCVAVPALAALAFFRNRIEELSAETALLAEHVFADYKRAQALRRREAGKAAASGKPKPRRPGTQSQGT